ncbi:MAG: bifunctional ornithine acetyltransferase/N-acetylglutamate synthase [Deltaproteobacteria bacterium]|nr:bifunctional ornithine acetyltransferase/N-acetylglutamate synthase [Deltaproteobacteria bacterium]
MTITRPGIPCLLHLLTKHFSTKPQLIVCCRHQLDLAAQRGGQFMVSIVGNCHPSFFGGDPNWGRILAATGRAGFPLDQGLIGLAFDDIEIVRMSTGAGKRVEDLAKKVMVAKEFTVILNLGLGQEEARILTSDLLTDYVRINADYRI